MRKGIVVGLVGLFLLCLVLIVGIIYGLHSNNADNEKLEEQLVRTPIEPRVLNEPTPGVEYGPTPGVQYGPTTRVHYESTTRVNSEPAPRFNDDPPESYPSFNHLGSLKYLNFDWNEDEYHCTAVVLTPSKLLTTTKCWGRSASENANGVLLGASDFKTSSNSKGIHIEIKGRTEKFENEIMILNLHTPISQTESAANVSVATRCVDVDLNEETNLFAVGFAQSEDMSPCNLFRQELHLISLKKCPNVSEDNKHVCVKLGKSFPPPAENTKCTQCLTASASVLHVKQSDGSICVAALATPTTKECNKEKNSTDPVSFTIINKVVPNSVLN